MQKLYHTWERALDSGDENHRLLGVGNYWPGRHSGFDIFNSTGSYTFNIGHSSEGLAQTLEDGTKDTVGGSLVTQQGTVVHENANIQASGSDFNIAPNSGTVSRIDWLVAEHQYVQLAGGSTCSYSLITGPSNGADPTLTNPNFQIVVGILTVGVGQSSFSQDDYEPAPYLGQGGYKSTYLNRKNVFESENVLAVQGAGVTANAYIDFDQGAGNIYMMPEGLVSTGVELWCLETKQVGTVIHLSIPNATIQNESSNSIPAGYSRLKAYQGGYGGKAPGQADGTFTTIAPLISLDDPVTQENFWVYLTDSTLLNQIYNLQLFAQSNLSQISAIIDGTQKIGGATTWFEVGASGNPTFGTNWQGYTGGVSHKLRYRLNNFGECEIEGAIRPSTGIDFSLNRTMFILPAGYRPSKTVWSALHQGGANPTQQTFNVLTDGSVNINYPTDGINALTENVDLFLFRITFEVA